MKIGDMVRVDLVRPDCIGIIADYDPSLHDNPDRVYSDEHYYWVVIPSMGWQMKWIKGESMEVISESR